ncbi:hypothetical protein QR98_0080360 [Sarcoptes scabiei]|uniref:Uncharacterized protein n=1 Tax=Sarcoptes scabiei TaxID=52283 RepID=A0A132AF66_SARSC|nr:hypothetical protein QR98_0080360 [Sarcoptes scabiei]
MGLKLSTKKRRGRSYSFTEKEGNEKNEFNDDSAIGNGDKKNKKKSKRSVSSAAKFSTTRESYLPKSNLGRIGQASAAVAAAVDEVVKNVQNLEISTDQQSQSDQSPPQIVTSEEKKIETVESVVESALKEFLPPAVETPSSNETEKECQQKVEDKIENESEKPAEVANEQDRTETVPQLSENPDSTPISDACLKETDSKPESIQNVDVGEQELNKTAELVEKSMPSKAVEPEPLNDAIQESVESSPGHLEQNIPETIVNQEQTLSSQVNGEIVKSIEDVDKQQHLIKNELSNGVEAKINEIIADDVDKQNKESVIESSSASQTVDEKPSESQQSEAKSTLEEKTNELSEATSMEPKESLIAGNENNKLNDDSTQLNSTNGTESPELSLPPPPTSTEIESITQAITNGNGHTESMEKLAEPEAEKTLESIKTVAINEKDKIINEILNEEKNGDGILTEQSLTETQSLPEKQTVSTEVPDEIVSL